LSAAFYKEKMSNLLNTVLDLTAHKVEEWKLKYADQSDKHINIIKEIADLITNSVQACIFGL